MLQDDVKFECIHFNQKYKICLESSNFNAEFIYMRNDMFQKKNMKRTIVEKQHNQLNVQAIRVDDYKLNFIFINEEKKNNSDEDEIELKIFSSILIASARTNALKFDVS